MKSLLFCVVIVLGGCVTNPPKCDPVTVVQEVKVPVAIKCKVDFPSRPITDLKSVMPLGLYEKGVFIIKEDQAYREYAALLEAALKSCADPK